MRLKSFIKRIEKNRYLFSNWLGAHFLWKLEKNPIAVVMIDGGLTSQMVRVAFGEHLKKKGFHVKYQLDFYKLKGYDMYHVEPRNYLIDLCFPDIQVDVAPDKLIRKYKSFYDYESGLHGDFSDINELDCNKPIFFSGYRSDNLLKREYCSVFNLEGFNHLLGEYARSVEKLINKNIQNGIISIGVHVRRGDMTETGFYWKVLKGNYFIKAIHKAHENIRGKKTHLFFFSNGHDFVKKEIIPNLENEKYDLVQGTQKEFEDFYLLSRCDVQIGSQGSWGEMAFLFNQNPDGFLITYKKDVFDKSQKGKIIQIELADDMYEQI